MLLAHLAEKLSTELNCSTLRMDFTGNGHSSGSWSYANYTGEHADLQLVVRFVREQMKCPVASIVGHSKGAQAVLRTAVEQQTRTMENRNEDRVPCFVEMSGRYAEADHLDDDEQLKEEDVFEMQESGKTYIKTFMGDRFPITWDDMEERMDLDSESVRKIKEPVLIIHGDKDKVLPVEHASRFEETIPNSEILIVEGGDHNFNGLKYIGVLVAEIVDFVKRHGDVVASEDT